MKKYLLTYLFPLLFALIISVPVILPYFHSGYFSTHDGEWAVVRLGEMFRELKDFQTPPRFSTYLNFGYGYPLFNFAYPFPYYLGIIFYFLKFGFVGSIKILFALSVPFSAFFMFLASRKLWKSNLAGIVSAILYIYLPYRIVDLYVRGSIGESLSFIFFPLIILFVLKIINNPSSKSSIVLASFSYAALITTHNIMAVLFSLVLFLFILMLVIFGERKAIYPLIIFVLFGFLLSAFFWLPVLFEKQYILLSKIPIADRNLYFVNLRQLLLPVWGYGVPTDKFNGFSYQLGLPQLVVLISTVIFLIISFAKKSINFDKQFLKYVFALSAISFFLLFFLFSFSALFWKLPFLSEINYPWTMLAPIGFLISLLAGFISILKSKIKYIGLLLAAISILFVLPYAKPQHYVDRGDNFYITNEATTTSSNELMPLWVKKMPNMQAKQKVEIVSGEGQVSNVVYNSKIVRFNVAADKPLLIKVNTIYYPGWKAKIDEVNTVIFYNNDMGIMQIALPMGNHIVSFSFTETPLRLASDIISVVSIVILLTVSIFHIFHLGGGLARTPRKNGGLAT